MKIKRLFYANQRLKKVLKLNGILTFLIIFLMTVSSFGQTNGITFTCVGQGDITFGAPDGTDLDGFPTWSNGSDGTNSGYTLLVEDDNGTPTWSVGGPNLPGLGGRYFFSVVFVNNLPSCNFADWDRDLGANGAFCEGVLVTCTSLPDPDNDGDGVPNDIDNCVDTANADQADLDGDGIGDVCDNDADGDGSPASEDCDDTEAQANPGLDEIPFDTIDNDCDGEIDENDNPPVVYEYCDDKQKKVLICHNGKTKCVSINAVDAHLAHGDYLGSCGSNGRQVDNDITDENTGQYDLLSWPNPTNNLFNIKVITPNYDDKVSIQAFDINGRLIHSSLINGNEDYQFGTNLQAGVYIIKVTQATSMKVVKVIKR